MQTVTSKLVAGKKVLLRLDLDVPLRQDFDGELSRTAQGKLEVEEDFRLRAGIPTLKLCLENASKVIVIGHLGRPAGVDPAFSLDPVREWFKQNGFPQIEMLENVRFNPGEEALSMDYAKELASLADIFVFEAFASYRPAVSTTILPTIMPHACGLRFAEEVEKLKEIRENPKKPFIAIMGGAKVSDKLPVIQVLAQKADVVLVGGKLVSEIKQLSVLSGQLSDKESVSFQLTGQQTTDKLNSENRKQETDNQIPSNVLVGKLTEDGFDIAPQTLDSWKSLILNAEEIVWNGPIGKVQSSTLRLVRLRSPQVRSGQEFKVQNLGSERGSYELAKLIIESQADVIIGGGDTIAFLNRIGLLKEFQRKGFVSTGGGAMLKLLSVGTLPTIEALK